MDNSDLASPSGTGPSPSGSSPAVSPVPASVPDAECYTTIVVRHKDPSAARDFIQFAHATWPIDNGAVATRMTGISIGDAMSVSDVMRMALECDELCEGERIELALDIEANCFTWAEGLALAQSAWDLVHVDGKFVDMPAQGIAARSDETADAGSAVGKSPVAESDAP